MMRNFFKLSILVAMILLLVGANGVLAQDIEAGISNGPATAEAQTGFTDFDPPCFFAQTLPLVIYDNVTSPLNYNVFFVQGNGAVLDQCSGFGVTGHSPPNFLAWNDQATNWDGSVPALPALFYFPTPIPSFSVKLGSGQGAAGTVYLVAVNSFNQVVDVDTATISANLQNLSVSGDIKVVMITAAFTNPNRYMVADDLRY
jgi:hypothetical protein